MLIYLIIKSFIVGGIKPINEFKELGIIKFIFQYTYYCFEGVLILLTISFGQKFMEGLSKNKTIPFGGLILAAIIYGIAYLLLNKNSKYSYLSILLMFIL